MGLVACLMVGRVAAEPGYLRMRIELGLRITRPAAPAPSRTSTSASAVPLPPLGDWSSVEVLGSDGGGVPVAGFSLPLAGRVGVAAAPVPVGVGDGLGVAAMTVPVGLGEGLGEGLGLGVAAISVPVGLGDGVGVGAASVQFSELVFDVETLVPSLSVAITPSTPPLASVKLCVTGRLTLNDPLPESPPTSRTA